MTQRKFRLDLQYRGDLFSGWQTQPGERTVEGALKETYEAFLKTEVFVDGSGRTDTGVHARHQIALLQADTTIPAHALVEGVLPYQSEGFHVFRATEEVPDWGPRPALVREYRYFLWKGNDPPLFLRPYSAGIKYDLDFEAMNRAASFIPGERDFSTFRAAGCTAKHAIRRVDGVEVLDRGAYWEFRVLGNAFLRQMVRILVGTLVEVGRGRQSPEWVGEILERRDRTLAGQTMPPEGLFLWEIQLEENEEPLPIPPTAWD